MKRLLALFLLAVLPLQISWAAAAFHCPQGGDDGVRAAAASAALHADHAHEHDGDDNDDGHAIGGDLDCGVLQLGLRAKGAFKVPAGTKAIATITPVGKPAINARFELK